MVFEDPAFNDADNVAVAHDYGFHESLGLGRDPTLQQVFEFLMAFYVTHSEWGEQL